MAFTFDQFVTDVRAAAAQPDANAAVRALLSAVVVDPDAIFRVSPEGGEDEVMLFEDETVSIWHCRFQPHVMMPPHEHKLDVHIGGYAGSEKSLLFAREDGALAYRGSKVVGPGEVLSLGPQAIHAVIAEGEAPSLALHVYMGPLMQLTRGLFDWETGEEVDFTLENFEAMKRPAAEVEARLGLG